MKFNISRTDLALDNNKNTKIIKYKYINNDIYYNLKKELKYFINKIKNKESVLIIGLGNDNYTADSIGPKTLKHIKVNSFLDGNIKFKGIKISALEPGVLGQTGIDTKRIVKSVVNEIKPNFLIIIDSFITNNILEVEKCIQISNNGITPGSGIMGLNSKINKRTIGIPVIVIGVPTALEINIKDKQYILASNQIDKYVLDISKIIGESINEVLAS